MCHPGSQPSAAGRGGSQRLMPGKGHHPSPACGAEGIASPRAGGLQLGSADKIRTQTADAAEAQLVGGVHPADRRWALTAGCLSPTSFSCSSMWPGDGNGNRGGSRGLVHPRLSLSRRQLVRLLLTDCGRALTRPGGRCKVSTPGLLSLRGKAMLFGGKDVGTYRGREDRARPPDWAGASQPFSGWLEEQCSRAVAGVKLTTLSGHLISAPSSEHLVIPETLKKQVKKTPSILNCLHRDKPSSHFP